MAPLSQEAQIARLEQRVNDCQQTEADCRTQNREEHTEIFDRVRVLETGLAVVVQRVTTGAAIGGFVGGAIMSIICGVVVYALTHKATGG